jgi:hypothetical protein
MNNGLKFRHGRHKPPYFTTPPAYVLGVEDERETLNVCAQNTPDGPAVICYLSPIDALIEVIHFASLEKIFYKPRASATPRVLFQHVDGDGWRPDIPLGWSAKNGHLLLRHGGALTGHHDALRQRDKSARSRLASAPFTIKSTVLELVKMAAWARRP